MTRKRVFIFGAGAEVDGLEMPLGDALPIRIYKYVKSPEGKQFSDSIKRMFGIRGFSYAKLIEDRIDEMFKDFTHNTDEILASFEGINIDSVQIRFARSFVSALSSLGRNIRFSTREEELQSIRESNETFASEDYNSIDLINVDKLEFSKYAHNLYYRFLTMFLNSESNELDILSTMFSVTFSYEKLLADNFVGLISGNKSARDRYIYLSWLLWGFLSSLEDEKKNDTIVSVYNKLNMSTDDYIVTMNYTRFVDFSFKPSRIIHFHSSLDSYVVLGTNTHIEEAFSDNLESYKERFDSLNNLKRGNNMPIVIPSMMPPMDVKPLLSNKYLERWADAQAKIINADELIVVGYSFNPKDMHFNDIIFNTKARKITIVSIDDSIAECIPESLRTRVKYETGRAIDCIQSI